MLGRSGGCLNWLLDLTSPRRLSSLVTSSQSGWVLLVAGVRPARLSQTMQTTGLQLGSIDPNPNLRLVQHDPLPE